MLKFIIFSHIITIIGLLVTIIFGHLTHFNIENYKNTYLLYHIYIGFGLSLLGLLTHIFVIFYFIITGKGIKEKVIDQRKDDDIISETRKIKKKLFPYITLLLVLLPLMPISGFAVVSGSWQLYLHIIVIYLGFFSYLFITLKELYFLSKNIELIKQIKY